MYIYIHNEIPRPAVQLVQLTSLGFAQGCSRLLAVGRSRLAPRLARSAALRALGRPGWLDLATLCAPGRPAGWIWLLEKRGPVQRNDDFAAQGQCFVDVALVALIWLLCTLLGALAASIWLLRALLGALAGSIWLLWSLLAALAAYRKPKNA